MYDEEGINEINANNFNVKVVGFDAGDTIRSVTVRSRGFTSLQRLEHSNTFRIDGMYCIIMIILHIPVFFSQLGHCITTAYPGEVCDLNSYAVGCDVNGLSATACRCYEPEPEPLSNTTDFFESTVPTSCEGVANFMCIA